MQVLYKCFLWIEQGIPLSVLQFPQTLFPFFSFLSLPKFLKEEAVFIATISLPRIHTPSFLLKSACHPHHSTEITLTQTPPMTSCCQIQMAFSQPSVTPDHFAAWDSAGHPSFHSNRVSAPEFQPQTARLESASPGFGRSPKLSFLIYEMGLIKPIIYVWHKHGQSSNCPPYFALISHASLPN